jgi:rhodanese-related sulfurtransferase
MRGDLTITLWDRMASDGALVLDVRTAKEVKDDPIPAGLHIPIDELRGNLDALPKDKPIKLVCGVGIRAHNAICLLQQHGYQASLLSGGVSTWQHFKATRP